MSERSQNKGLCRPCSRQTRHTGPHLERQAPERFHDVAGAFDIGSVSDEAHSAHAGERGHPTALREDVLARIWPDRHATDPAWLAAEAVVEWDEPF